MRRDEGARAPARMRRLALAAACAGAAVAAVLPATAGANLRGDLQRFQYCPYQNHEIVNCLYGVSESGEFVMGKTTVPVSKPLIIQGGTRPGGVIVAPTNGEVVSRTPLPVPGGLLGVELFGNPITSVEAVSEVAGQSQLSTSIHLPLKVKLENIMLGGNCYIGSEEEPITLNLIYGTTSPPPPAEPISGELKTSTRDGGRVLVLAGRLVDNAFAVPGAGGCTLLPILADPIINSKEGLPSPAGKNKAVLVGANEQTGAALVRNTLPLPAFGRCVKVTPVAEGSKLVYHGDWANSSCTAENTERLGKYQWIEGPGPKAGFTASGGAVKLTSASGAGVVCAGSTGAGSYTGAKTLSETITLTGCHIGPKSAPVNCQSSGAGEGSITTAALDGSIDFIHEGLEPEVPQIGALLHSHSGSSIAAWECGGRAMRAEGSFITPLIAVDKMSTLVKAKAAGGAAGQVPESFEGGAKQALTFTQSGGPTEKAGLTATISQTGEEAIEIKGLP